MSKNRRTASAKPVTTKAEADRSVKDIRRATRKIHNAEEKIRIVLAGLRGEDSIAELCRREGIAQSLYYSWSKEFLEAGKKRLAGDTAAYSTEDGHRFHGIVGSHSTPRAVWPTGAWSQARADRSSGFMVTARLRMLSPARGSRCAL